MAGLWYFMDILLECALAYKKLFNKKYIFKLGRKGKIHLIELTFSEVDFHHLAGLKKLDDIKVLHRNRALVFKEILKTGLAKTANADILKSCCVPHGMRLIEN